jgi:hypothetical protein
VAPDVVEDVTGGRVHERVTSDHDGRDGLVAGCNGPDEGGRGSVVPNVDLLHSQAGATEATPE